jgi:type III pantothenate kinase
VILAINIGNTHITLGGYKEEKLVFSSRMATELKNTEEQYAISLKAILDLHELDAKNFSGAIISSVVPGLTALIQQAIRMILGVTALIVGPGVKSGLNILIDNPAQLGADLVTSAVAAISKFPLPCILIYFETATTISVIDKKGNFKGCIISAGVNTTLDILTDRTALLTHVSIETPPSVIGKNSIHSMQSGLVYGTACMIDGLVSRIEQELKETTTVVATGQRANEITRNCQREVTVADNLILEGLRLIYLKNI